MRRANRIFDAQFCGNKTEYTPVPNDFLRNPEITMSAKTVLSLLLANRKGWTSYKTKLLEYIKEGPTALENALKTLEEFGYLARIRYRDNETKKWVGSFWAYTDKANHFEITENIERLEEQGYECIIPTQCDPHLGNPHLGNPHLGNPALKRLSNKKTKEKEKEQTISSASTKITKSQFETFWKSYPKKVDKGKARSIWNKLTNLKNDNPSKPTWKEIKKAIYLQKKTDRWQDPTFIPHPTTWLNQSRWEDNPEEMKVMKFDQAKKNTCSIGHLPKDKKDRIDYSKIPVRVIKGFARE